MNEKSVDYGKSPSHSLFSKHATHVLLKLISHPVTTFLVVLAYALTVLEARGRSQFWTYRRHPRRDPYGLKQMSKTLYKHVYQIGHEDET